MLISKYIRIKEKQLAVWKENKLYPTLEQKVTLEARGKGERWKVVVG